MVQLGWVNTVSHGGGKSKLQRDPGEHGQEVQQERVFHFPSEQNKEQGDREHVLIPSLDFILCLGHWSPPWEKEPEA